MPSPQEQSVLDLAERLGLIGPADGRAVATQLDALRGVVRPRVEELLARRLSPGDLAKLEAALEAARRAPTSAPTIAAATAETQVPQGPDTLPFREALPLPGQAADLTQPPGAVAPLSPAKQAPPRGVAPETLAPRDEPPPAPRPILPRPLDMPAPGTSFGRYELRRELARGGMGVVYAAWDPTLGREVALKVVLGDPGPGPLMRFKVEAQAAARVRHPNVVAVHDLGVVNGKPYLTMDLIVGEPLSARLERELLDPREAARIMAAIARGLHQAHELGVLHRDLKPGNVLLRADGTPLLTDFGLAKLALQEGQGLTKSGEIMGTPAYIPPEQATGLANHADARTDVYGLGATLYHALTGTAPQSGPAAAILARVVRGTLDPPSARRPDLPRAIEAICLKAMALEPKDRHPTALALALELEAWAASVQGPGTAGVADRAARALRRRALPIALVTGLLSLVVLGLGLREASRGPRRRALEAAASQEAWAAAALAPFELGARPDAAPPPAKEDLERRAAELAALLSHFEEGEQTPDSLAAATRLRRLREQVLAARRALDVRAGLAVTVPDLDDARGPCDLVVDALALRARGDAPGALARVAAARARSAELAPARWLELELLVDVDPAALCARLPAGAPPERVRDLLRRGHAALVTRAASARGDEERTRARAGLAAARLATRRLDGDVAAIASARAVALEGAAPVWSATLAAAAKAGAAPAAISWLAEVAAGEPAARPAPGSALQAAVEGCLDDLLAAWTSLARDGDRAQLPALERAQEAALLAEEAACFGELVPRRSGPRLQAVLRRCVATGRISTDGGGGDPHAALACLRSWQDDGRVDEGFGDVGAFGADALFRARGVDQLLADHPRSRARALIAWRHRGTPKRIDQDSLEGWLADIERTLGEQPGQLDDLAPCYRWQPIPADELEAAAPPEPAARAALGVRLERLARAARAGLLAWDVPVRGSLWWSALLSYLFAESRGAVLRGERDPLRSNRDAWLAHLAQLRPWAEVGGAGSPRRAILAQWLYELARGHEEARRLAEAEARAAEAEAEWAIAATRALPRGEQRLRARIIRARALRGMGRGAEAWALLEPSLQGGLEDVELVCEATLAAHAAGQAARANELMQDAERRFQGRPGPMARVRATRGQILRQRVRRPG